MAHPKLDNVIQHDNTDSSTDCINSHRDNMDATVSMDVKYNQQASGEVIDFTADISLDQIDTQKEITDEDVMHHLDVIENIELDPETFGINHPIENIIKPEPSTEEFVKEEKEEKPDIAEIKIDDTEPIEKKWYEKKVAEKELLIRERLSKLARVLAFSYPHYEKWLSRIEKIEGSPMCKLDPVRRCPLNKPHTNRWKFVCSKKTIQQSVKEEGNTDLSNDKSSKTIWHLEPTGSWGVNIYNTTEFPSFVINAVKIFEDFLQTTIKKTEDTVSNENLSDDISMDVDQRNNAVQDGKQQWLWLLVRCNSMDELMLFATGKNISRITMERLKHTYEFGPGKNCNVKSLYCKSMNKCEDKIVASTTFLVGAEALDEVVGNLKVQLAPKTNFWSNAAGAVNVAKAVADLLKPTPKTTVLEIGCGIGVIGLMLASKCREVIGVDLPTEIEEAEMTCELNGIKNASFIMGSPHDVVNKISAAVKNRVTYTIINANTNMGRAIEVMTCLRKMTSLRRIVMVTTLTKQSVRAILELARPVEHGLGHPFMPIRACVVDTLPTGPHFETVILMERRLMHRLTQPWFLKILEEENKSLENTRALEKIINNDETAIADTPLRKNPLAKIELVKKPKQSHNKKTFSAKSGLGSSIKNKAKLKREVSPDIIEIPKKILKKSEKSGFKPWQQDVIAKKKNWLHENPALRINPLFEKKTRDNKEQVDLREKLSNNRIDTDLIQKVNESREILEAAKEKLSGPSPTVDVTTAKELQNVLSLVLEQTNKYQNQLPRSVWDRIAPPESAQNTTPVKKELDDDPLLKGRFVQETCAQDIVITTANKEFLENEDTKPKLPFRKYHNLAPLEPNMVMPAAGKLKSDDKSGLLQSSPENRSRQQSQGNSWARNKNFDRNRWNDTGTNKNESPIRKQVSPFRYHRVSPLRRFSPKRPLLSPPRRPSSPPRRHVSPNRRLSPSYPARDPPMHREYSPQRRPMSPLRHMVSSSGRRQITPPRRPFSPPNRMMSPSRQSMSQMRRQMSPPKQPMPQMRRQMSPLRRPLSPPRRQMSPLRMYGSSTRPMSPERRPMSPVNRITFSPRPRDTIPPRHQSPIRRLSPHRMPPGHVQSSPRRQQSPPKRHQSPPLNRFVDEWDIPSRGAAEQCTWQRSINERPLENIWHNEKPTTSGNWQPSSDNDRYRKLASQDKSWDTRNASSHSWNAKQPSAKPIMKELWQNSDNRWTGPPRSMGSSGENWNTRAKETLNSRKESWIDTEKPRWEPQSNDSWNPGEKDDWNDLPEDARDPWGDEGNLGLKERWMNIDNQIPSSSWSKEHDKGDSWTKSKDSWQNKSQDFPVKPPSQNNGNPSMNDPRWLPSSDVNKKAPSTSWQGSSNIGSWQPSNHSFQSQRSFNTNLFKERR